MPAQPVREKLEALEGTISDLADRVTLTEQSSLWRWFRAEWRVAIPILLSVAGIVWFATAWAVTHAIDDRVEAKMKDHHIDQIASDMNTVKGQLAEISGFLKVLAEKELSRQASLPGKAFEQQIPAVADAVTTARVVHAAAPANVVSDIHQKLLKSPPTAPGYWRAAAQFVSYRSDLKVNFEDQPLPNCFALSLHEVGSIGNSKGYFEATLFLNNCQLNLDAESGNMLMFETFASRAIGGIPFSQIHYNLDLTNVRIISHGGNMIPIYVLFMHNCQFRIQTEESAPVPAKALTKGLLLASDDSTVRVDLS